MNYELRIKKGLFLLASCFLLLACAPAAQAQTTDIGIYPPIFQIQTTPPSDVKVPFFIQNYSSDTVNLTLSLKPFTASDSEDGQVSYLDTTGSFPDPFIFERVRVLDNDNAINTVVLAPTQKKDLTLEIQIPSNEPKGDYYFSLISSSNAREINTSNTTGASAGIASNILLTVGPVGKTQGVIEEFSSPSLVASGPVPFTIRLRNTSDHFYTPTGNIVIKNMFGQSIGKVDLLPVNVLSNTVRRIPDSLQSPTVNQNDYVKVKDVVEKNQFPVAVWPEKFLLGFYTARLTLSLSDQGPVYTREIMFFAFPIEYILGILVIITMIAFIILRVRQRINR